MKILKEFLKRKKIVMEVVQIIETQFGKTTISKLMNSDDKKTNKKLQQIISKLTLSLRSYVSENNLGIYGNSLVLKTAQEKLLEMGFDIDIVKGIVESTMLR